MEENLLVLAKGSGEEQKVAWEGLGEEMKRMIDIAGPMVVVTASQRLLQVVSVMMVGHLNDDLFLSSAALAISLTAVTGFSFLYHHLLVHHLHGVELGVVVTVVAEATEVDGADAAEDGRVGEVGGAMRLHEEALRGRGGGRDN
ncbi:hypothetical protein JHK82_014892 [Glycine max]|uniref:Protein DETOXIFICATION 14 n=1 Tax=Glycine soja TaxID=3848 RepID=A0A445K7M2_GLYSO|nr:hypothetical protein JHK82_014892 [Glycine max]RZC06788.1 Protein DETOXIFICATION 14 [Glycine soja]